MLTSRLVSLQCVESCQWLGFFALRSGDTIHMASSILVCQWSDELFQLNRFTMSDAPFQGQRFRSEWKTCKLSSFTLHFFSIIYVYINPSSTVFHNQTSLWILLEMKPGLDFTMCAEQLLPCDDPGSPVSPFTFSFL